MSLQLNFTTCVTNGCTNIKFTETTGVYSTTNPGGWGAPNPEISNIYFASIILTSPNNVTYTIDIFDSIVTEYNNGFIYTFSIPGVDNIIDGKWTIKYEIVTRQAVIEDVVYTTYSKTKYFLYYCNSECCVNQMLLDLDLEDCECDCKDITYNDYIKAWTFLEALKEAARCGSVDLFTKLKKIVDKLCKNKDCKTCK